MREDQALIVAIELLRKKLGDLPDLIGSAANTKKTAADYAEQARGIAEFIHQRDVGSPQSTSTSAPAATAVSATVANTEALKENTVALKALQTWIEHTAARTGGGDLPTAMPVAMPVSPSGGGGSRGESAAAAHARGAQAAEGVRANPLVQIFTQVAQKFASILSPFAVLNAAMNSTTSGFQLMSTAVKLVAIPLSAVFLPVTLAVSAGLLALSESLMDHLPLLDQFMTTVLGVLIPTITFFVGVIDSAADHIQEMQEASQDFADWVRDHVGGAGMAGLLGPGGALIDQLLDSSREDVNYDYHQERMNAGLSDALRSLRQQIGPRAQSFGLESAGRSLQVGILNSDPLEVRLMRDQIRVLERIERAVDKRNRRGRGAPYRTGAGELADDTGSGGSFEDGGDF